jgi:hypothetical protein
MAVNQGVSVVASSTVRLLELKSALQFRRARIDSFEPISAGS